MSEETPKYNAVRPSHYIKGGMECIDVIKAITEELDGFEGYCIGNALKYIWRWKEKNGVEDLRKAIRHLEYLDGDLQ